MGKLLGDKLRTNLYNQEYPASATSGDEDKASENGEILQRGWLNPDDRPRRDNCRGARRFKGLSQEVTG